MRKIPADILKKIENKRQVISENAQPSMKISVARAKISVLDSSYWTVEEIRAESNLGAISIAPRRLSAVRKSPDKLFSVHVEDGIGIATSKNYPGGIYEEWEIEFDVGNASDVAIAFDGLWKEVRNKWRFETFEKPWIFWIDNGILYRQYWDDVLTKEEIANDVIKIAALRGWNNENLAGHDQGLVIGYIKNDNKIYYRTLAYQEDDSLILEVESQVTEFTDLAVNLNLFITLDYRLGFAVERIDGSIWWLITPRNWAGLALGSEKIEVSLIGKISLNKVEYIDSYEIENISIGVSGNVGLLVGAVVNEFSEVSNIDDGLGNWNKIIKFKTKYELFELNVSDFEIVGEFGMNFIPIGISFDGDHYILEFEDFNNVNPLNTMQITLTCFGNTTKNEAGDLFNEFAFDFIADNLEPEAIDPPVVLEVTNV